MQMLVVFKNTLAPSQTSWVSSCIRGSNRFPVESCVFSVLPHLLRVGSNTGRFESMNLIKRIHRCNLRCVLRPRNRAIPVFRCHFLVDTGTAPVCTGSLQFGFLTLLMVDSSFVKLPVLNLYWIWIESLQVLLNQLLIHKTWPCVRLELNKTRLNSLLIRASCPRLPDINSVETWWTCPQKWSRKFLPVSTSRLQLPHRSVGVLHHNK